MCVCVFIEFDWLKILMVLLREKREGGGGEGGASARKG